MTRLYIFAADSTLGLRAASESNRKGTAYIERELRRLGLVPGGADGTFLQAPMRDTRGAMSIRRRGSLSVQPDLRSGRIMRRVTRGLA